MNEPNKREIGGVDNGRVKSFPRLWKAPGLWCQSIGKAFSEIAVEGEQGNTTSADPAFDLATSKELWRTRLNTTHLSRRGSDDGEGRGLRQICLPGGRLVAGEPMEGKIYP